MGNRGDMTELELFKVSEVLKDRFSFHFKKYPEAELSHEALDRTAPILAKIINNFNKTVEENSVAIGVTYLVDTLGYYIMLGSDIQKTNEELLKLLEKYHEKP